MAMIKGCVLACNQICCVESMPGRPHPPARAVAGVGFWQRFPIHLVKADSLNALDQLRNAESDTSGMRLAEKGDGFVRIHSLRAELSRRQAVLIGLGCGLISLVPGDAVAGGVFEKYLKRKMLDPLDTYLPTLLLSQLQFEEIEEKLIAEQPNYYDARSLLRSGPASSLRTDMRAVAHYAVEAGNGQTAKEAVDGCLRAIEELDSYLLLASRNKAPSLDLMKQRVTKAVRCLDSLLSTVPEAILEKGKSVAYAYRSFDAAEESDKLPSDLLKTLPSGL